MDRKVLLIAEDQTLTQTLEQLLEQHKEGFTLLTSEDSAKASQLLADHFISLIILEATSINDNDFQLLTQARKLYPGIPAVIISDNTTSQLSDFVDNEKEITLLAKPFQTDSLANLIEDILNKESAGGIMRHISPAVFLQYMDIEPQPCTIRILDKTTNTGGILYFDKGDLIDARVKDITGIDAAYIIFGWEDDVTILIQNDCPLTENIINSELQPIILKAASMKSKGDTSAPKAGNQKGSKESAPQVRAAHGQPTSSITTPSQKVAPKKQPAPKKAVPRIKKVEYLLNKGIGARCHVEDIYEDRSEERKIRSIDQLEKFFSFGKLKLAYIQEEERTDRILIPGDSNIIVVDIAANGLHETIIRVLKDRL